MARPKKEKRQLSPLELIAQKIGSDWEEVLSSLESSDSDGLKSRVTLASQSIHDATEELNQNGEYLKAKEDCKLLSQALKDVRKRQNAIIKTCLEIRKARGEA